MRFCKIFNLLVLLLFIYSCNKTKIIKETSDDPDTYYKKHYKDDKLSFVETYYKDELQSVYYLNNENGIRRDTLYHYVLDDSFKYQTDFFTDKLFYCIRLKPDGTKISEGNMYKYRYNGWWKIYDENGKFIHEKYIIGKDTANYNYSQIKVYDTSGKIVPKKSDYISIFLPDTLYTGKSMGHLIHHPRLKDQLAYYVGVGYDILPDFSNISNVRVDTFDMEEKKTIGVEFKTPGKTKIRGFIYESAIEMESDLEFSVVSVHTYFEKEFYVIPRPDSIPKDKVMRYGNLDN